LEQVIAYQVRIQVSFEEAVEIVTKALESEGFGVLTQIDVKSTLKEKLGEDFRPYIILGACNPPLAHRALSADSRVGVMLPCNVTVEQQDEDILISLANPEGMLTVGTLAEHPEMKLVAQEANERIQKVATLIENHP
jgi:uncharacterized protein (DUF302 family)